MGKILLTVDDRVRFHERLPKLVEKALEEAHTYVNPDHGKKVAMGFPVFGTPREIKTYRRDADDFLSFPRGGMHKVRALLRQHRVNFSVRDARCEGLPVSERSRLRYVGPPMRDYQVEMGVHGLAAEQCIIRAATGGGKSFASYKLMEEIGLNTLVILPTSALFEQWAGVAESAFGISGDNLGIIQGGKRRLRPLTIAMQQTMANRLDDEIKSFFGCVLVDEVQRAAAETIFRVVDAMPARYRIGVSACEKRRDRKDFLIYDLFSKVVYEADREYLASLGYILDVAIKVVPTTFAADWYGMQNGDINFNKLLDEMTADEPRNAQIIDIAMQEIQAGERVVVLTHRREHAKHFAREFTARNARSGLLIGEGGPGDAEEFARTKLGIENGTIAVGVGTYGAMGYGIDLPAASVGIATTPISANEQNFNQARGRFCRTAPGKKSAKLYVMMDTKVYDQKHVRNLAAWNGDVTVLDGRRWMTAKQWLARKRSAA